VIQHSVKFQQSDHSEHADQQPKQYLVTGEHDQQSDCPKRHRADEPQNESGAGRRDVRPSLLQCRRHAWHHLEGTNPVQARMRNCGKVDRLLRKTMAELSPKAQESAAEQTEIAEAFTEGSEQNEEF